MVAHKCNKEAEIAELKISFNYTQKSMDEIKDNIKEILDKLNNLDEKFASKKEVDELKKNERNIMIWIVSALVAWFWAMINSYFVHK